MSDLAYAFWRLTLLLAALELFIALRAQLLSMRVAEFAIGWLESSTRRMESAMDNRP